MTGSKPKAEEPPYEVYRPLLNEAPYRYIIFDRANGAVPLYLVGGLEGGPWSAENALRKAFEAKGGQCYYCKTTLNKDMMTVDHVEGRKGATSDALQNLVLACKPCNAKKAHQPIEVFAPAISKDWLHAALSQIQDRLKKLETAQAPTPNAKAPAPASPAATSAKA